MRVFLKNGGRFDARDLCNPIEHRLDGNDAIIEDGSIVNIKPQRAEELILAGIADRIQAPSKKLITVSLKMEESNHV